MTIFAAGDAVETGGLMYVAVGIEDGVLLLDPLDRSRAGQMSTALGPTGPAPIQAAASACRLLRSTQIMSAYVRIREGDDDGAYRKLTAAHLRAVDTRAELDQLTRFMRSARSFGLVLND